MNDIFTQERLRIQELSACGTATRVPICMCVDASFSMVGPRIEAVLSGIRAFIRDGRADPYACDSIDLCLISFGGSEAKLLQPFAPISRIDCPQIEPGGGTPLGMAIGFALDQIAERMTDYESMGMQTHSPHLIIISDGAATDGTDDAESRLRRAERDMRVRVQCVRIGDDASGDALLRRLDSRGRVMACDAMSISAFFGWVSQSAAELSTEGPTDADALEAIYRRVEHGGAI